MKTTVKQLIAVAVMALSGGGALLCLAGIAGAWLLSVPVKQAVERIVDATTSHVALATRSLERAEERLSDLRGELEEARQRVRDAIPEKRDAVRAEIADRFREILAPRIDDIREASAQIGAGLASLNSSLETLNLIFGFELPAIADGLQTVDERLGQTKEQLRQFQESVSALRVDAGRLDEATSRATEGFDAVEKELRVWQDRLGTATESIRRADRAVSTALTQLSLAATLFFGLFGAGQASLFLHAWRWFREGTGRRECG